MCSHCLVAPGGLLGDLQGKRLLSCWKTQQEKSRFFHLPITKLCFALEGLEVHEKVYKDSWERRGGGHHTQNRAGTFTGTCKH